MYGCYPRTRMGIYTLLQQVSLRTECADSRRFLQVQDMHRNKRFLQVQCVFSQMQTMSQLVETVCSACSVTMASHDPCSGTMSCSGTITCSSTDLCYICVYAMMLKWPLSVRANSSVPSPTAISCVPPPTDCEQKSATTYCQQLPATTKAPCPGHHRQSQVPRK